MREAGTCTSHTGTQSQLRKKNSNKQPAGSQVPQKTQVRADLPLPVKHSNSSCKTWWPNSSSEYLKALQVAGFKASAKLHSFVLLADSIMVPNSIMDRGFHPAKSRRQELGQQGGAAGQ